MKTHGDLWYDDYKQQVRETKRLATEHRSKAKPFTDRRSIVEPPHDEEVDAALLKAAEALCKEKVDE